MKHLFQSCAAALALALMAGFAAAQSTEPTNDVPTRTVPEPALMTLAALGAGGIAWRAYKRRHKK